MAGLGKKVQEDYSTDEKKQTNSGSVLEIEIAIIIMKQQESKITEQVIAKECPFSRWQRLGGAEVRMQGIVRVL